MPLNIDWGNNIVQVTSPDISVSGQVLHDFVEDQMAAPEGLLYADILKPEGKIEDPTNPGVYSQIIIVLSSLWQIQFWQGSGYTKIFGAKIVGGVNDQPMKATGAAGDITVLESPVDGVTVASTGAAQDIAIAVWDDNNEYIEGSKGHLLEHTDYVEHIVFINTENAPVVGRGTELEPFGFTSDGIDFAELHGFRTLGLVESIDIDRDIHNFSIKGVGGTPTVDTGTFNLDKTNFYQVELKGLYTGSIVVRDSFITGINTHINGVFSNCGFVNTFKVPDGGLASILGCYSLVGTGFIKPKFSIGGVTGTASLEILRYYGGITVTDCNQPTDNARIGVTGIVEIDSSCTDGEIVVIGNVKPIDNSGPGCTVYWFNVNPDKLQEIYNTQLNKRHTDEVAKTITTYEDDQVTIHKVFDYVENAEGELITVTPQ